MPLDHRDPFASLLVAQSICESLLLVCADAAFHAYGGWPLAAMTTSSDVFQAGFHTLTPKIFHQQVSDFPIHRVSEMFLPIKEVGHLAR